MGRNQQFIRQWKLLLSLGHYGRTIRELAADLEVDERTIRRDLKALEDAGFPLTDYLLEGDPQAEPGEKRWRLIPGYDRLPPIPIDRDEAFAVLVASRSLRELEGTPIGEAFNSLVDKLRRSIKPLEQEMAVLAGTYLAADEVGRSYAEHRQTIEELLEAINARRLLEVTYHASHSDETTRRTIAPLCLWRTAGELYLIAHCYLRDEARSFRLDRFVEIAPSSQEHPWPEDFDPVDFIRFSFGPWVGEPKEVVLRFSPRQAKGVEGLRVHETQRMRRLNSGELELRLRVSPSLNLAQWLAGFGGQVRVESPEELRRWVAQIHAEGLSANAEGVSG